MFVCVAKQRQSHRSVFDFKNQNHIVINAYTIMLFAVYVLQGYYRSKWSNFNWLEDFLLKILKDFNRVKMLKNVLSASEIEPLQIWKRSVFTITYRSSSYSRSSIDLDSVQLV